MLPRECSLQVASSRWMTVRREERGHLVTPLGESTEEDTLTGFIYVVEVPSPEDFYFDRREGEIYERVARLHGVDCSVRTVVDRAGLKHALQADVFFAAAKYGGAVHIVHLAAHGSPKGLLAADGDTIPWDEVAELLRTVNDAVDGELLVCASCCFGASATAMAGLIRRSHPFDVVVYHSESPTESDAAIGFAVFYHRIMSGATLTEALSAMRVATQDERWEMRTATQVLLGSLEGMSADEIEDEIRDCMDGSG